MRLFFLCQLKFKWIILHLSPGVECATSTLPSDFGNKNQFCTGLHFLKSIMEIFFRSENADV